MLSYKILWKEDFPLLRALCTRLARMTAQKIETDILDPAQCRPGSFRVKLAEYLSQLLSKRGKSCAQEFV